MDKCKPDRAAGPTGAPNSDFPPLALGGLTRKWLEGPVADRAHALLGFAKLVRRSLSKRWFVATGRFSFGKPPASRDVWHAPRDEYRCCRLQPKHTGWLIRLYNQR